MGYETAYRQVSISTANPSKLLLMLFVGLARFIRQSMQALENGDLEAANGIIMKAENIVVELRNTLKHEYAPELAESLDSLYAYFYNQLVQANIDKSKKCLEGILPLVMELKDAFEQAAQQLAGQGE